MRQELGHEGNGVRAPAAHGEDVIAAVDVARMGGRPATALRVAVELGLHADDGRPAEATAQKLLDDLVTAGRLRRREISMSFGDPDEGLETTLIMYGPTPQRP